MDLGRGGLAGQCLCSIVQGSAPQLRKLLYGVQQQGGSLSIIRDLPNCCQDTLPTLQEQDPLSIAFSVSEYLGSIVHLVKAQGCYTLIPTQKSGSNMCHV